MAIDTVAIDTVAIDTVAIDTVNWHYVNWHTANCRCQLTLVIAMVAIDIVASTGRKLRTAVGFASYNPFYTHPNNVKS